MSRIYNDHTISTNLKKCSLKKLILDTYTKIAFSVKNLIYEKKMVYTWVLPLGLSWVYYDKRTTKKFNYVLNTHGVIKTIS